MEIRMETKYQFYTILNIFDHNDYDLSCLYSDSQGPYALPSNAILNFLLK